MIPAEAVEAAARAMYEDAQVWRDSWSDAPEPRRDQYLGYARLALEAAAPHMHRAWIDTKQGEK